ncbi:MAG: HNH endonuclease [Planctomycetota bacterium]
MLNQNTQNNMDFVNLSEGVSLISVGKGLYRMVDTEDLRRLSRIRLEMEMENKVEDFRLIPLTQGKFAIVDAEDYDRPAQHKWCAVKGRDTFYAQRGSNGRVVSMHREIMRAPKGVVCDHKNHNGLDNRKSNLRLCTSAQNQYNKKAKKGCSSRYKGVVRRGAYKRWRARIGFNRKRIHLGDFADEKQAAMAYDDKAAELFGEFAYLNFPERIELRNWIRKIVWAA